jgi:hypothetical protein
VNIEGTGSTQRVCFGIAGIADNSQLVPPKTPTRCADYDRRRWAEPTL